MTGAPSLSQEGAQEAPPGQDDQLFTDASQVLELSGGSMTQTLFFKALTGAGYNQVQVSQRLRADPRLSFRGMDVYLVNHKDGKLQ